MKSLKKTVCLGIPTYNREQVLINTLNNAFVLRPKPDEILVVDQTIEHEKETEQFLKNAHRKKLIKWIKQQPPSVPMAFNRMLKETHGDVLILIDDDVEMPKDFVAKHLRNYRDDRVEVVAGRISHRARFATPHSSGRWSHILDYKYFPLNSSRRVEGIANVMGCNFSARLSTLKKVGGCDLNYNFNAFRFETDLAIRIWKAGGLIVYDPKAHLNHLEVPYGGTRSKKGHKPVEWKMPFARSYFAFRHLFPTWEFWWMTLFQDQRETVLRKYNLFRPWRIPWAFLSYWYAVVKAGLAALKKQVETPGLKSSKYKKVV